MEQLQQLYRERAARKPQPHELDPKVAAEAFLLSLRSFPRALSPYTIDKFTKCGVSCPKRVEACLAGQHSFAPAV